MSSRGDAARAAIVDEAARMASVEGLEGLSLGVLARRLGRSKSGLFAHFESKEELQLAVLRHVEQAIIEQVIKPSIREPRGLPRVRQLFKRWGQWAREQSALPGGCIFVNSAIEFDDKKGPVRDALVADQVAWLKHLQRSFAIAIDEGHVRSDADPEQLAFEMYSLMLGSYHYYRLLGDRSTLARARAGFERLLTSVCPTLTPPPPVAPFS